MRGERGKAEGRGGWGGGRQRGIKRVGNVGRFDYVAGW